MEATILSTTPTLQDKGTLGIFNKELHYAVLIQRSGKKKSLGAVLIVDWIVPLIQYNWCLYKKK